MKRQRATNEPALRRWLAAEAAERPAEAETALAELFAALPRLAPPAGFADRVMLAAALAPPAASRAVAWTLRGLLAAAVALVALGVPSLPRLLAPAWAGFSLSRLFDAVTSGLVAAARWIAAALSFWDGLARLGAWVAQTTTAPAVATALLAGLVLAAAALRLLAELIAHERSWSHVEAN
jgi:hypothetical protein